VRRTSASNCAPEVLAGIAFSASMTNGGSRQVPVFAVYKNSLLPGSDSY